MPKVITQESLFDVLFFDRPPQIPVDVCRSRHKGSPESVAANPTADQKRQSHERILAIVRERGTTWLHQLCRLLNKPPNEVSPRLSELKEMGLLEKTGARIEKCAVLRIKA